MAKLFYDWVIMELLRKSQQPAQLLVLKTSSGIERPIVKDLIDSSFHPSAQLWGFPSLSFYICGMSGLKQVFVPTLTKCFGSLGMSCLMDDTAGNSLEQQRLSKSSLSGPHTSTEGARPLRCRFPEAAVFSSYQVILTLWHQAAHPGSLSYEAMKA